MKLFKNKKGFTLTELIVTVALLSIVAGASVAVIFMVKDSLSTSQRVSTRQFDTTIAETMINSKLKVASGVEEFTGNCKTGDIIVKVENGIVVMQETIAEDTFKTVFSFYGLEKAIVTVNKSPSGKYNIDFHLVSDELDMHCGTVANNMKTGTERDVTNAIVIDKNNNSSEALRITFPTVRKTS